MCPFERSSRLMRVVSPNVSYEEDCIRSKYEYWNQTVTKRSDGCLEVTPTKVSLDITTKSKVSKTGVMMVGLGGNNGTTLTGMILANKHSLSWRTKTGEQRPDFLGSVAQSATFPIGLNEKGEEVFVPVKNMIPLLEATELEIDGWDISSLDMAEAMKRAAVFDIQLQDKLIPYMKKIQPRPAVFYQDFVAGNQRQRADNLINGNKSEQLSKLRQDIQDFKKNKNLEKVIVMWVGNTERYVEVMKGLNDTWENLEKGIKNNAYEISSSTIYSVAAVLEGCSFINGSPQNALVPAVLELAKCKGIYVAGDDLKTGQTKLKSVLVDYLVGAGLKPESIVSYNHLGNNDGMNLSAPHTFRSKEISKRGVVDDMIASNDILYPDPGQKPDHLVVIKYVPYVGDSKRAMDEYISKIAMGGENTLVIHNTCEDSLLAAPIMLDLITFMELFQRMEVKVDGEVIPYSMGNMLGYWLKAPLSTMTNSLFRQRSCIENLIKAAISLPPTSHFFLNIGTSHVKMGAVALETKNCESNGCLKEAASGPLAYNGLHESCNLVKS